ncbi:hypothetical protein SCHPADRAFT_1003053 [Schizopora paradoxa]|uniref:Uncharacterized protein n=1 Tax=Schizopora paradoxa TaxID=27342 RepID=A0A0H2RJZ0_9AGAM|nr:hypothetical protein SCHPADRAFT_1003053 [Schizopora paradoxa]
MGWKKLGDDERELCRSLDYVIESAKALKEAVQMGRRMDGEGERKVDSKELWCRELACSRSPADASIAAEDSKAALGRMKDARKTLALLSKSLEDTIQEVSEATIKACQAAGFALLPDDVLAHIFEMYIDECIMPKYGEFYIPPKISPQILSSVCKRFRDIVYRVPNLWRNISLVYPKELLRLHRERCTNPSVHIFVARDINHTRAEMLDMIHPHTQWRELRLHFLNEDHAELYFERLQPLIDEPFHSLEYLSISNDISLDSEIKGGAVFGYSIYLHGEHMEFVSSWEMPMLTQLELRNFIPLMPLQCENVTRLSIHLEYLDEDIFLEISDFQNLFQWVPKVQSLSITFNTWVTFKDADTPEINLTSTLPGLTHLDLGVEGETPSITISRFMTLIDTRRLTHLGLKLGRRGGYSVAEALFSNPIAEASSSFAKVDCFTLEAIDLMESSSFFERVFTSLPNVQDISLRIPQDSSSNICIGQLWMEEGAFQNLRSLEIEILKSFQTGYFSESEKKEARNRWPCFSTEERGRLRNLLGERLTWIER